MPPIAALHRNHQTVSPIAVTFSHAPTNGIAILDRIGTVVTLGREEPLFFEGDAAECYYKVVKGVVRGCTLLADGRRHIGDFFLAGDFIGLDADQIYSFAVEGVTDATLIRYSRRKVDALAAQEPQITKCLVSLMRDGLSSARQRMTLLGHMTAMERIAFFLLDLADRSDDARIALPMTRTDIGDYLGLTMETVSRAFSQLKSGGVIQQKGAHEVTISDRSALEDLTDAA
jgi:CRP-like cAMP-binding protein